VQSFIHTFSVSKHQLEFVIGWSTFGEKHQSDNSAYTMTKSARCTLKKTENTKQLDVFF
jgi:hypothetical protein